MKIFPSILSADFSCLNESIEPVLSEVDQLHLDVMDGNFVPNISFGPPVIQSLSSSYTDVLFDAHLMIESPEKYLEKFLELGVDWISVHVEVNPDLQYLKRQLPNSVKLGLAFNPSTQISEITPHLEIVDYVLAMTVKPGFSGQSFREDVLHKLKRLRNHYDGPIQVDGGVGAETIGSAHEAGADWFVSGSSVFGDDDPASAVRELRSEIQ